MATMTQATRRCGLPLAVCSRSEPRGMSGFGVFIILVGACRVSISFSTEALVTFILRAGVFPQKTPMQIGCFKWPVGPVARFRIRFRQQGCSGRRQRHGGVASTARPPGETPHPVAGSSETCQNWSRLVKAKRYHQEQHSQQTAALLLTTKPRLCKE